MATEFTTRLAVKFKTVTGEEMSITPIESIAPSVDTPWEIMDSIEADNVGVAAQNNRITFDFTTKGINDDVMREMYAAAINREQFEVGVYNSNPDDEAKDHWAFDSIIMPDCYFSGATPVDISNEGGVPTMSFNAIALSIMTVKDGTTTTNTRA